MQTRFSLLDWWFYYQIQLENLFSFLGFLFGGTVPPSFESLPQFLWKNQGLLKYLFEFSPNWSSCKRKKKKAPGNKNPSKSFHPSEGFDEESMSESESSSSSWAFWYTTSLPQPRRLTELVPLIHKLTEIDDTKKGAPTWAKGWRVTPWEKQVTNSESLWHVLGKKGQKEGIARNKFWLCCEKRMRKNSEF